MSDQAQAFSEVAKRYAGALLALADEQGQVDAVGKDLARLGSAIDGSATLASALANPLLRRDQVAAALTALMTKMDACDLSQKFVGLVAKNGRAKHLGAMVTAFATKLARRRGELTAQVTSARPLSAPQVTALTQTLAKELGAKVQISAQVDPRILGGLVVQVGSKMIDSSLKTKLQKLKLSLSKGLTTKGMA